MTFESDRDLIADLSDEHASSVLGLIDDGVPHDEAPPEFRAALAAAHRSPDVSRFLLTEKRQRHLGEESHPGKGVE